MRVRTKFLLFVFVISLSSGWAFAQSDVSAGAALVQRNAYVNVLLKKASIREVFSEIKKQAKVSFMYSNEDVKELPVRDYNLRNATLSQVMEVALAGSDLTFEIVKDTILIKRKGGG